MNVRVEDLMSDRVIKGTPHQTVQHARKIMNSHNIHAIPIVNPEDEPIGIVTSTDLLGVKTDAKRLSDVMTRKIYTIPKYSDTHLAARVMRNHHTHHVIVTHEKKLIGVLSTFDLLQLVEDHRFVMKNAPTEKKRGVGGHRA